MKTLMDHDDKTDHLFIVSTADGSNTIYNTRVGENYHSRNGALQESTHVFIQAGLQYFFDTQTSPVTRVSVLEVGFGTGLNFLLSAAHCTHKQIALDYTGIEAYPLKADMIGQTGYRAYVPAAIWGNFLNFYTASLLNPVNINEYCRLHTVGAKLMDFTSARKFDVIYFDAFAASRQPEMWDDAAIAHTLSFLNAGGVFVTYAITGNLKRTIKALGLKVYKVPGAAGKREMLRAVAG